MNVEVLYYEGREEETGSVWRGDMVLSAVEIAQYALQWTMWNLMAWEATTVGADSSKLGQVGPPCKHTSNGDHGN